MMVGFVLSKSGFIMRLLDREPTWLNVSLHGPKTLFNIISVQNIAVKSAINL